MKTKKVGARLIRWRWGRVPVIFGVALALAIIGTVALASGYQLLVQGSYEKIGDAIYRSYTPTDASGSGTFDPFLRISSNSTVVQGYNTDWKNRTKRNFRMVFTDATTTWEFAGFVTSFSISAQLENVYLANVTIKLTGAITEV